jgi:hypothetical protein
MDGEAFEMLDEDNIEEEIVSIAGLSNAITLCCPIPSSWLVHDGIEG